MRSRLKGWVKPGDRHKAMSDKLIMELLVPTERADIECDEIFDSYQNLRDSAMAHFIQNRLIEAGLTAGRNAFVKVKANV